MHVPRVLFHDGSETCHNSDTEQLAATASLLQALLGQQARVTPVSNTSRRMVKRTLPADVRVSVLVPTKDNPVMLEAACRSVERAIGIEAELIVIDNGAESDEQARLLVKLAAEGRARVVQVHEPFNFSRLINLGRAAASGNVLLLLNDDVEALDDDWLAEMVAEAMRPDIGCVGALLLYPDGTVQHAGVMLGINGGAGHAFRFAPQDADPEAGRLQVAREVSAVTAACLAVKTSVFDAVGGFAEDLPVTLNDVDFCLRVREAGLRNLFTPHARLIHRESTSRGLDASPAKLRRLSRETSIYIGKWGRWGLADPYVSPFASFAHEDYRPRRL